MTAPRLKNNAFAWAAIAAGVMIFFELSDSEKLFPGMDRYLNFSAGIVHWVGPYGWLLLFLFGAWLISRFRSSRLSAGLCICLLILGIVISCVDLFAEYSIPIGTLAGRSH